MHVWEGNPYPNNRGKDASPTSFRLGKVEAAKLWEGNPFPDNRGRDASPTSFRLGKVEAVEIHDLVPRRHKVMHERLTSVITRVDFRDGSELRV